MKTGRPSPNPLPLLPVCASAQAGESFFLSSSLRAKQYIFATGITLFSGKIPYPHLRIIFHGDKPSRAQIYPHAGIKFLSAARPLARPTLDLDMETLDLLQEMIGISSLSRAPKRLIPRPINPSKKAPCPDAPAHPRARCRHVRRDL